MRLSLLLLLATSLGCSASSSPGGEGAACRDDGTCDEGLTCLSHLCVRIPDASSPDGGRDAGTDAARGSDASMPDAFSLDAGSDAFTSLDSGSDGGSDAGNDGGSDAGPPFPDTCTTSAQCGATATCDTSLTPGRCICITGYAPCTAGCCAISIVRDLTLPEAGHTPELGFDAAGNVYVLYLVGHDSVHLATITPSDATSVVTVGTTSGSLDAHDLVVLPDGTVIAGIHVDLGSRSGDLVLHTRAPGATTFTTMGLTTAARPSFAYDAAVGLSRAPDGQIWASVTERSGDGTRGLYISHFDPTTSSWNALANALGYDGFNASELFARDDGFFIGAFGTMYDTRYYGFDPTGTTQTFVSTTTGTVYGTADFAGAMTDANVLYTYTTGFVSSSAGVFEPMTFPLALAGARADLDMAIDHYGDPVFVTHSTTQHEVGFTVRMPHGGYAAGEASPESFFVTSPATTMGLTLDAERATNGNLAIAIGDRSDQGPIVYQEYAY